MYMHWCETNDFKLAVQTYQTYISGGSNEDAKSAMNTIKKTWNELKKYRSTLMAIDNNQELMLKLGELFDELNPELIKVLIKIFTASNLIELITTMTTCVKITSNLPKAIESFIKIFQITNSKQQLSSFLSTKVTIFHSILLICKDDPNILKTINVSKLDSTINGCELIMKDSEKINTIINKLRSNSNIIDVIDIISTLH